MKDKKENLRDLLYVFPNGAKQLTFGRDQVLKLVEKIEGLKRGNTALLSALMGMVLQYAYNDDRNRKDIQSPKGPAETLFSDGGLSALEEAFEVLVQAGMMKKKHKGWYRLLWKNLEKRMEEEK